MPEDQPFVGPQRRLAGGPCGPYGSRAAPPRRPARPAAAAVRLLKFSATTSRSVQKRAHKSSVCSLDDRSRKAADTECAVLAPQHDQGTIEIEQRSGIGLASPRHCGRTRRHRAAARARRIAEAGIAAAVPLHRRAGGIAAKAEPGFVLLPRHPAPRGLQRRRAQDRFIAVIHGRRAAQRQQEHGRDARLCSADAGGDARLIVIAQHPIRPAAGRQSLFILLDQASDGRRRPMRSG